MRLRRAYANTDGDVQLVKVRLIAQNHLEVATSSDSLDFLAVGDELVSYSPYDEFDVDLPVEGEAAFSIVFAVPKATAPSLVVYVMYGTAFLSSGESHPQGPEALGAPTAHEVLLGPEWSIEVLGTRVSTIDEFLDPRCERHDGQADCGEGGQSVYVSLDKKVLVVKVRTAYRGTKLRADDQPLFVLQRKEWSEYPLSGEEGVLYAAGTYYSDRFQGSVITGTLLFPYAADDLGQLVVILQGLDPVVLPLPAPV